MGKKQVIGLALLAIVGLTAVSLLFWPFFGDVLLEYCNRIPFEPAAWKAADRADLQNPVRLRMVDDLLRRHRLVGMSRAEIDALLGVPEQKKTSPFGGTTTSTGSGRNAACSPSTSSGWSSSSTRTPS
jgi:hypothetical protein